MQKFRSLVCLMIWCLWSLSCNHTSNGQAKMTDKITTNTKEDVMVLISTELGDMKVKLYKETPQHRANFVKLAKEGFYNGTLFHKVIANTFIQGGNPNSKDAIAGKIIGNSSSKNSIPAEILPQFFHKKGALCAVRERDNINPNKVSSASQFYIVQGAKSNDTALDMLIKHAAKNYTEQQKEIYKNIGGLPFLDQEYTIFGEVIEGLEVIDKIAAVETVITLASRPLKDIKMEITVLSE